MKQIIQKKLLNNVQIGILAIMRLELSFAYVHVGTKKSVIKKYQVYAKIKPASLVDDVYTLSAEMYMCRSLLGESVHF